MTSARFSAGRCRQTGPDADSRAVRCRGTSADVHAGAGASTHVARSRPARATAPERSCRLAGRIFDFGGDANVAPDPRVYDRRSRRCSWRHLRAGHARRAWLRLGAVSDSWVEAAHQSGRDRHGCPPATRPTLTHVRCGHLRSRPAQATASAVVDLRAEFLTSEATRTSRLTRAHPIDVREGAFCVTCATVTSSRMTAL